MIFMSFDDMFKPYSPELKGDLEEYLRKCEGGCADNHFFDPDYFFIIKEKGWMVPDFIYVRVNMSPVPDTLYFVNNDFLLESKGVGEMNMSAIGAREGVYDPNEALKDKSWSIHNLDLWKNNSQ